MREDLIYFSDRRFMHLGWGYVSSTHVHCASVLSVTFERDFWVQGRPGSPGLVRRGVVIPPGAQHCADNSGQRGVALYFEPDGAEWAAVRESLDRDGRLRWHGVVALDDDESRDLVELIRPIDPARAGWRELDDCMSAWIACIAGARQARGIDARVTRSAHLLRQDDAETRLSERRLAESVALSGSRLRHLFKRETGVPLCRYRVWGRLRRAIQQLGAGASPTDAALQAGFTDAAHFNHAFKANFGVSPAALFGRGRPQPRVVVAPDFAAPERLKQIAVPGDMSGSGARS